MTRKWTIYKITNPKGRVYIGRTVNFKKRMYNYAWGTDKSQRLIYRSVQKYGWDSHEVGVLEEFEGDLAVADSKEIFWIRSYMSHYSKYPSQKGMNLTSGGGGMLGRKLTEKQKKQLSDYNKVNPTRGCLGHKMSEESKAKMSLKKIGKPPPNKGKKMPPHQVEMLKLRMKGKPSPTKGNTYDHLTPEERKLRFGVHNIGHTRNRGRKMSADVVEANRQRAIESWRKRKNTEE